MCVHFEGLNELSMQTLLDDLKMWYIKLALDLDFDPNYLTGSETHLFCTNSNRIA